MTQATNCHVAGGLYFSHVREGNRFKIVVEFQSVSSYRGEKNMYGMGFLRSFLISTSSDYAF